MFPCIVYILILLLCEVKSDKSNEPIWTDMKNNVIQVNEYCKNKNCVVKCCPDDQFYVPTKNNTKTCIVPKRKDFKKSIDFSNIKMYEGWSKSPSKMSPLTNDFVYIQNDHLSDLNKTYMFSTCEIYILKDGTLKTKPPCIDMSKLQYCVAYYLKVINTTTGLVPTVKLAYSVLIANDPDGISKHYFVAAGMLTSSFFMLLVLLVYSVLRKLQNIVGMVLMAYLLTQMIAFIMKAVQLIALAATSTMDKRMCRITSPITYYFMIASFCWMNVMSFDLWWTIRGTRKHRDIHRQGEIIKFFWYGLYAWGFAALLTINAVTLNSLLLFDEDHNPPFDNCYVNKKSTTLYVHVPIGIMTAINCILFLMTAYNVWLVKRAIQNIKDSRNTKNSENRFAIYIKLSVLMGVSWILELLPDNMSLIPHIIVNFFNVFVGVAIFLLFVCKKSIIVMLSKRFRINNKFIDKLQYSKSVTETTSSIKRRKDGETGEALELATCTSTM